LREEEGRDPRMERGENVGRKERRKGGRKEGRKDGRERDGRYLRRALASRAPH
jgi:hypothetical protein